MGELAEVAEALVVRPGDKLIIRVSPGTTPAQFDKLLTGVRERLPDSVEVLVIAAEQLAVFRG